MEVQRLMVELVQVHATIDLEAGVQAGMRDLHSLLPSQRPPWLSGTVHFLGCVPWCLSCTFWPWCGLSEETCHVFPA